MGNAILIEECEHGSDPYCCVPCANARGVERIGSEGLDLSEVATRPIRAAYNSACRWPSCEDDIRKGDMIVAVDPLGFIHWHHVTER